MNDSERQLPDVDTVVDVLTTPLPADPSPSTIREYRTACREARQLLDADPTLARSLAVPLAATLRDNLAHRDRAGASSMFGIDLFAREAATAAAAALEAIPVWRLIDTDIIETFVAAVAAVAEAPGNEQGRLAAATALERASVYAPTVVAAVLEDSGLGDDLLDAVTPLPDPTALDPTTARILVALVHTDQAGAVPNLSRVIASEHEETAVTARLTVLDATTPTERPQVSNASDRIDEPINRLRDLAPALGEADSATNNVATTDDSSVEPTQTEGPSDDAETVGDGEPSVTPPRRHDALTSDDESRTADTEDDRAGNADRSVSKETDRNSSENVDESGSEDELRSEDESNDGPEFEPAAVPRLDKMESNDTKESSDSQLAVEEVLEPLALVVASDKASAATRSRALDTLVAATTTAPRDAFHELGVLASLDVLTPDARDRLRDHVVETLVDGDFFGAFDRATRGRRVAFMEHHDVQPAALATPDHNPPVAPLVLDADLLTPSDLEHIAETLVDAIENNARSSDERQTLGWLHVHTDLPEPPLARLRSTLIDRLAGDEDDHDWALDTIIGLAGYGILDADTAAEVLDAVVDVVTGTATENVPGKAGRAVSALLTANALADAHVTHLVDRLPELLQADVVPPARTGARILAALATTERLPNEIVSDVLGITTQLCTVDEGGANSISLRVAAVHALQGLATNYHIPPEHRKHVLGALSIVARGDGRLVDQSRRAALESYRVICDEMPLPEFDADILLPILETALVQLLPSDRFEERPRDGTGPGPSNSRLTTRAAETLRDLVVNGLIDVELFTGVLSVEDADATWLKNYPPAVIREHRPPRLGRFLAPDNPAVPPFLTAVAAAATENPNAFAAARPTLERFLARTDPTPAVAAGIVDVLSRLDTLSAAASTPHLR